MNKFAPIPAFAALFFKRVIAHAFNPNHLHMRHLKYLLLFIFCGINLCGNAQETTTTEANTTPAVAGNNTGSLAPLGITTGHVLGQGKWMAAYTFSDVAMKDNRIGTSKVGNDLISQYYMLTPETMSMQMHIATLEYGISDRLTVMATGGYTLNSLYLAAAPKSIGLEKTSLTSKSSGFTDTKVSALYNFINKNNDHLTATLGVNVKPTGTIRA